MIAGPDSRAQIAIQAAERLRELGEGVPWEVSPPLPVWSIWALSTIGVSPENAYIALVVLAFAGSAWAVFELWRRISGNAGFALQAAALAVLAPSGWLAILERGEIDRLLFWKLVPFVFLAIDVFRRKPNPWRLGLIFAVLAAMVFSRSSRIIGFDALALAEWVSLVALCRPWRADTSRARLVRLAGAAVFALIAVGRLAAVREPGALGPMPASLVAQAAKPVVGPVSLEARLHPSWGKVHELINGDLRPRESLLWLQALGAQSVIAPAHGKFARYLECVSEEAGWCVFDVGSPAPPTVLVSRERFETLKPIRGLYDVEGLERYLTWAMRPEAVGFERSGRGFEVTGTPGPDDVILVRLPAWDWIEDNASITHRPAIDPVGYSVLDSSSGQGGHSFVRWVGDFQSALIAAPPPEIQLDDAEYPRIAPEGVVEGSTYAPPPFQPGAHVSIFGERFRPDGIVVLLDGATCPITYASTTQINVQLPEDVAPGSHELVVNSANRYSYPYRFEVVGR